LGEPTAINGGSGDLRFPAGKMQTIGAEYGAKPSCKVREKTLRTNNIV
jgi:hypothetical protein